MTPKEFRFYAEIFSEKTEQESHEKLMLTWLGAHWQRVEKLEPFENYMKKKEEKPQEMSTEQMLAKVMELNAKMGGSTVTPGGEN